MPEQLTLYLHKLSPYSLKIELALTEANVPYRAYQVDFQNKPEWFTTKVNPAGARCDIWRTQCRARFFIDATTKHIEGMCFTFIGGNEPYGNILKGIEFIQQLLEEDRDFAVGNHYTIADACISPQLTTLKIITESDIVRELKGPKFTKFMKYAQRMLDRPSLKQTYDEEFAITFFKTRFTERVQ
ncbi:hypothetical protein BDR04DRAFT_1161787 [Suillus decipiens]|nr:hypothetical protein BDR04DRAFT_1161787 [Suillus decipiens]